MRHPGLDGLSEVVQTTLYGIKVLRTGDKSTLIYNTVIIVFIPAILVGV